MKDDFGALDRAPDSRFVGDIAIQQLDRQIGALLARGVPGKDDDASGTAACKLGDQCLTDRPRTARYKEIAPADRGVEIHVVVAAPTVRPMIAAIRSATWPSPKVLNRVASNHERSAPHQSRPG